MRAREGDLVVTARRADMLLAGEGEARQLARATFTGAVQARRGSQTGKAEKAVWEARTGDLVMEGHPVVEQQGESISGERIVLDGATGKARVETAVVKIRRP